KATYYKAAGSSEPSSYTWTLSASQHVSGGIQAYTYVNLSSPVDVSAGQMTSSSSSVTAPSVTTAVAGEMLVGLFGMADGRPTFTPPSGMTERFDVNSGTLGGTASEGTDVVQA